MEQTLRNIKMAVTGLAGAITAVFGWMGWLVILWAGCMAADYVTGTLAAARAGQWSSQKARDGLWHKAGMFFVVFAALALDVLIRIVLENIPAISLPFAYSFLLAPLVLCWYVVTELGSMAENAVAMGAPCPAFLQKALEVAQAGLEAAGDSWPEMGNGQSGENGGNEENGQSGGNEENGENSREKG